MLTISLAAFIAVLVATRAESTSTNIKDGSPIAELPENWDQTKDDTQSLFLNKSDKNDLEPYPLALSEEGNSDGYEQAVEQHYDSPQATGELDNLIMRPEYYAEPPAMEGLSAGYDSRRRKRGSTKVGGAGAATKVVTKNGSGKKNLKSNDAPLPVDSAIQEHDVNRRKRGGSTKVSGAAASAKSGMKNSGGNKKNFRPISDRRKRDSGLSAADVRALLNLWEAQERRKQEWNANQWADNYYGRVNTLDEEQPEVDENGDVWYNEPVVMGARERDYPRHSYFSEQNRMALARGMPDIYQVDPNELAQRYEEARRKRMYVNKMKRFMVARKRSDGSQTNYRPRDDLYTLAELLRSAHRVQDQELSTYASANEKYCKETCTSQGKPEIYDGYDSASDQHDLSEHSLDVHIPSYPGSPRSLNFGSDHSLESFDEQDPDLREAIAFLHQDKEFLIAAEIGNVNLLEKYISKGTHVQQVDHLGRNALHLAVCSDNNRAIKLLLDAGVNPNVKDNLGMTPLSLSLMRRPSLVVANLLFDYGARLIARSCPMDTGLFIQFVMMCTPTIEEENILRLLVHKGAVINDPQAPGGRQALHFAAMSNNATLIRILVSLGADLYMTNHRNDTPKEVAATYKCKKAYDLLDEFEQSYTLTNASSMTLVKNST